jgi:hypothetical protein
MEQHHPVLSLLAEGEHLIQSWIKEVEEFQDLQQDLVGVEQQQLEKQEGNKSLDQDLVEDLTGQKVAESVTKAEN